jgi:hypothetical protein
MYSVRIGYEGYEITLMFRDEKTASYEYEAVNKAWADDERIFVTDAFKRKAQIDTKGAVAVTFTDEEAAAMARAEVQLHDARATMKAQQRFQAEQPMRIQGAQGLMRPS